MNGFKFCLSVGEQVEQKIFDYLEQRGHKVIDTTADKEYQKKDIDCLIEHEGQKASLEIKSDSTMHHSGNFFFEEGFDRFSGFRNGWFNYCEADFVCFYDNVADNGYIVNYTEAKAVVKKQGEKIKWFNTTDNCVGYAYLLPIDKAREEGLIAHEFNLRS